MWGGVQDCEAQMLEVGYERGDDRIVLWLPWIGKHVIDETSPLSHWLHPSGYMQDANSTIVVTVSFNAQSQVQYVICEAKSDGRWKGCWQGMLSSPVHQQFPSQRNRIALMLTPWQTLVQL